ncbi:MAG: hypothetical protein ACLTHA_12805, partial [Parasutterella sp.]
LAGAQGLRFIILVLKTGKLSALRALAEKYSPGIPDNEDEIQHSLNYVFMTKLVPEWITGKQAALEVREASTTL